MPYRILLKRSAEKELGKLPPAVHDRVVEHLVGLKENPRPHGVKKLTGYHGYRLRVGDYRILYTIDEQQQEIEVFAIGHRREVYRQ